MDNLYSSYPLLFYDLKLVSTGVAGTLRPNRKGNPVRNPAIKIETWRGKGNVFWKRNKHAENL